MTSHAMPTPAPLPQDVEVLLGSMMHTATCRRAHIAAKEAEAAALKLPRGSQLPPGVRIPRTAVMHMAAMPCACSAGGAACHAAADCSRHSQAAGRLAPTHPLPLPRCAPAGARTPTAIAPLCPCRRPHARCHCPAVPLQAPARPLPSPRCAPAGARPPAAIVRDLEAQLAALGMSASRLAGLLFGCHLLFLDVSSSAAGSSPPAAGAGAAAASTATAGAGAASASTAAAGAGGRAASGSSASLPRPGGSMGSSLAHGSGQGRGTAARQLRLGVEAAEVAAGVWKGEAQRRALRGLELEVRPAAAAAAAAADAAAAAAAAARVLGSGCIVLSLVLTRHGADRQRLRHAGAGLQCAGAVQRRRRALGRHAGADAPGALG